LPKAQETHPLGALTHFDTTWSTSSGIRRVSAPHTTGPWPHSQVLTPELNEFWTELGSDQ